MAEALRVTLGAATAISTSEAVGSLSDGFEDLPKLRVYPQRGETDSMQGNAPRTTFRSGIRVSDTVFSVDVICHQRANVDEDMTETLATLDSVEAVLIAQKTKPFFGEQRILDFWWSWEIVSFSQGQGDSAIPYLGLRISVTLKAA